MRQSLVLLIVCVLGMQVSAENFAVLVAGSNGFWNYRHQADICHAYHTLLQNGYKAENIITFSYNDVATSTQNPVKGKLFNRPTGQAAGVDVNEGCVIDYSGNDVTPQNFLAVLEGNATAVKGGRVLQSGPQDNVFLNFADHGAPGLIAFPRSYLYEKDLTQTFKNMYQNQRYAKLVFYLEACESGSMFLNLPKDINIYALSAASPDESSWGFYCPPQDQVGGVHIGSCLGDLFSINWMEDTDNGSLERSLQEQYTVIRDLTTKSKVMQWGDLSFSDEPIKNYLAGHKKVENGFLSLLKKYLAPSTVSEQKDGVAWDSRDNKLLYLINRFKNTQSEEDFLALQQEFKSRQFYDKKFELLSSTLNLKGSYTQSINQDCLQQQIETFEATCGEISDYGLKYVKYLAEMCDNSNLLTSQLTNTLAAVCEF